MERTSPVSNPARFLILSFLAALAFLAVPAGGEESPRPLKAAKLVRLGGRAFDRPLAACPDGSGGCLIVLETSGRYAVGRGNVRSKQVERWLVRLDGSMKWSWAENLKSPAGEGDEGFGVCPAADETFLVGGLALPRAGKGPLRIFLMGEDIQGRRKFRKRFGGSENGFYALCAAPDGGCWFAASITGKMRAGKTTLESEGGEPLYFLARADAGGSLLFALPLSRRGEADITALCPDGRGGVWVAGTFSDSLAFGRRMLTASGDTEAFAAHADKDGKWLCASCTTGSGSSFAEGAALCPAGDGGCWLAGQFGGSVRFGEEDVPSESECDVFTVRLKPGGRFGAPFTRAPMMFQHAADLCPDGKGGCWLVLNAATGRSVRNPELKKMAELLRISPPGRCVRLLSCEEEGVVFERVVPSPGGCLLAGTFAKRVKLGARTSLYSRGDDSDLFVASIAYSD